MWPGKRSLISNCFSESGRMCFYPQTSAALRLDRGVSLCSGWQEGRHPRLVPVLKISHCWVLSFQQDHHRVSPARLRNRFFAKRGEEECKSQSGGGSTKHHLLHGMWQWRLWSPSSHGHQLKSGPVNPTSWIGKGLTLPHPTEMLLTVNGFRGGGDHFLQWCSNCWVTLNPRSRKHKPAQ